MQNLSTVARAAAYSVEKDVVVRLTENETVLVEKQNTDQPSVNVTIVGITRVSTIKRESSQNADELKGSNVSDVEEFPETASFPEFSKANSSEVKITQYTIDEDKEVHTISLESQIQGGIYSLEIDYDVCIDRDAFFASDFSSSNKEQ